MSFIDKETTKKMKASFTLLSKKPTRQPGFSDRIYAKNMYEDIFGSYKVPKSFSLKKFEEFYNDEI